MSGRDSTFERLALKEKMLINQQMKGLGELNAEYQQLDKMRQKLDEITKEQTPIAGEQMAGALRDKAQLNYHIRDQLETANNRCEHLAAELQELRRKIAHSDRRRERSAKKAEDIKKQRRNEIVTKQEDEEASRRRRKTR